MLYLQAQFLICPWSDSEGIWILVYLHSWFRTKNRKSKDLLKKKKDYTKAPKHTLMYILKKGMRRSKSIILSFKQRSKNYTGDSPCESIQAYLWVCFWVRCRQRRQVRRLFWVPLSCGPSAALAGPGSPRGPQQDWRRGCVPKLNQLRASSHHSVWFVFGSWQQSRKDKVPMHKKERDKEADGWWRVTVYHLSCPVQWRMIGHCWFFLSLNTFTCWERCCPSDFLI